LLKPLEQTEQRYGFISFSTVGTTVGGAGVTTANCAGSGGGGGCCSASLKKQ